MDETSIRLSKFLSQSNICSRREAEYFIDRGWVQIDGEIVSRQGVRVTKSSKVVLDKRARDYQNKRITILVNKPIGFVSGQPEPGRKPAASLIKKTTRYERRNDRNAQSWKWPLSGLAPAGRLDSDSSGLLVFTQDGRIARQLIGPNTTVDKEYMVRTSAPLTDSQIEKLTCGLSLDGVKLRKATVEPIDSNYFRMILRQGRYRQIRRMCELVGLKVVALKRVRIGRVRLGALPLGKWRLLHPSERF